jgi:hypothetical protein
MLPTSQENRKYLGLVVHTCHTSCSGKHKAGGSQSRLTWAKEQNRIHKITRTKKRLELWVKWLPCKCETLSLNTSAAKKKKKKRERQREYFTIKKDYLTLRKFI